MDPIFVSIASLLVAIVSAIIAIGAKNETIRIAKWTVNFTRLTDAETMVKEYPEILKMHGVSEEDLNACNASAEEVVYLLQSFRAGQEWSRIATKKYHSLSPYRKQMLDQPKVQCIWNRVLRERLLFDSPFVKAVDSYILLKKQDPKQQQT